ncbi:hypothetical protein EKO27_g5582 [Xylaria grammica]|uniref:Cytochrome P450 n=1 Tax=Xylaria grammica TaxID=363999 RepID=A0A439D561_9PEZI|nr:hypothetical protein EKO27_g5582 [Xylaria grammica]
MADINVQSPILIVGFFALLIIFACRVISNVFFHPLSAVPGPTVGAASDLWLVWRTFTLRKCETLHECLSTYGSVARVAPNKIVVSSQADIKTIYGIGSKCLKSQFYEAWAFGGAPSIFATIDPKDHSMRRSIASRTFAKKSIMQFMPDLTRHAQTLAKRLEALSKQGSESNSTAIDFIQYSRYLALDMLGSSVLDEDFGLLRNGIEHPFVHDLDAAALKLTMSATLHPWLWAVLKRLPIPRWKHLLGGDARLAEYATKTVEHTFHERDQGKDTGITLVSSYAKYEDANGARLSTGHIVGEIASVYFAGTDTTSATMGFTVYQIAMRQDVQSKLRAELVEKAGVDGRIAYDTLENDCPYLNAVISECLRLYTAAPSHLERVVPPGGITLSTGHYLPAGTIVGVQVYSLHRDPAVFPDPELFDPDRWLRASPEMRQALSPWGFGSRICLGMHLAHIQLQLALAVLVGNFHVTLPEGFDHEKMRMKNFWLVFPIGRKAEIAVKKLEEGGKGVTVCA